MRARQEPLFQALRFLTDIVPKEREGRIAAIRDFANANCPHGLQFRNPRSGDLECCDCGLILESGMANAVR